MNLLWWLFPLVASFADLEPPPTLKGYYAHRDSPAVANQLPCRRVDKKLAARLKKVHCFRDLERPDPYVRCDESDSPVMVWFAFTSKAVCEADARGETKE